MQMTVSGGKAGSEITLETVSNENGLLFIKVHMMLPTETVPEKFTVRWKHANFARRQSKWV